MAAESAMASGKLLQHEHFPVVHLYSSFYDGSSIKIPLLIIWDQELNGNTRGQMHGFSVDFWSLLAAEGLERRKACSYALSMSDARGFLPATRKWMATEDYVQCDRICLKSQVIFKTSIWDMHSKCLLCNLKTLERLRAEPSLQTWLETHRQWSQFFALSLSIALCFLHKQENVDPAWLWSLDLYLRSTLLCTFHVPGICYLAQTAANYVEVMETWNLYVLQEALEWSTPYRCFDKHHLGIPTLP